MLISGLHHIRLTGRRHHLLLFGQNGAAGPDHIGLPFGHGGEALWHPLPAHVHLAEKPPFFRGEFEFEVFRISAHGHRDIGVDPLRIGADQSRHELGADRAAAHPRGRYRCQRRRRNGPRLDGPARAVRPYTFVACRVE